MAILNIASLSSKITKDEEKIDVQAKSNSITTNVVESDIVLTKTVSKSWALPQEEIDVTTTITNNMNVDIVDINIKDTLGEGATFVAESLVIGSESKPDLNPIDGFSYSATIGANGGELTMSYKVMIDKYPAQSTVKNKTTLSFDIDGNTFQLNSNEGEIEILENEVYLLKQASPSVVKRGDEITYTITISNDGTLDNTDLMFTDALPEGTTFVENSMTIDGQSQEGANPANGFALKDLGTGESIVVQFKVLVN